MGCSFLLTVYFHTLPHCFSYASSSSRHKHTCTHEKNCRGWQECPLLRFGPFSMLTRNRERLFSFAFRHGALRHDSSLNSYLGCASSTRRCALECGLSLRRLITTGADDTLSDGRASSLSVAPDTSDALNTFSVEEGEYTYNRSDSAAENHRKGPHRAGVIPLREMPTPSGLLSQVEAATLSEAAARELRAEVERDMRDGVSAIPPLPPRGWQLHHPAGSRFFYMSRTLKGGASSSELNTRRYQSVHDSFLNALRNAHAQRRKGKTHVRNNDLEMASADPQPDANPSTKVVVDYRKQGNGDNRMMLRRLIIHKTVAQSVKEAGDNPLESLVHMLEDDALVMYVRLANVNSEVRIRSVQFISLSEAQALYEHACFGAGEPLFLELVRRLRRPTFDLGTIASLGHFTPRGHYDDPRAHTRDTVNLVGDGRDGEDISLKSFKRSSYIHAYKMLLEPSSVAGEYSRTLCYGGPYITELSKEMVESLQEYLQGDLGVSAELCEYVCQMQFYLEQEEYMAWLGQLQHIGATVASRAV
uniref:Uncharacterized protein n=1 Tax=Trypanosoma vivax (strain Y486) TaxID=1055687 RepID=G0UAR5_TRYVY|nr:conserved hypothetical protein, fragment [Trypanosoma vivax Y486]